MLPFLQRLEMQIGPQNMPTISSTIVRSPSLQRHTSGQLLPSILPPLQSKRQTPHNPLAFAPSSRREREGGFRWRRFADLGGKRSSGATTPNRFESFAKSAILVRFRLTALRQGPECFGIPSKIKRYTHFVVLSKRFRILASHPTQRRPSRPMAMSSR